MTLAEEPMVRWQKILLVLIIFIHEHTAYETTGNDFDIELSLTDREKNVGQSIVFSI